jgi:muconolactone delta-isomerase
MNITQQARPKNNEEGEAFYRTFINPTLKKCQQLQEDGKILAGGPVSGTIGLALFVKAETVTELDQLLTGLPVWPLMETTVTPLTTFADRAAAVESRFKNAKEETLGAPEPQA